MSNFLDMFSPVDICFFVCLLFGGIWGICKGLSGELAQLGATIICFIISLKLTPFLAAKLAENENFSQNSALLITAVAVIFFCFLLLFLLRRLFQKIFKIIIEVRYDRFLGFFAGIIHYGIILVLLIIVIGLIPWETTQQLFVTDSVVGRNVMRLFPTVLESIEENTGVKLPLPHQEPDDSDERGKNEYIDDDARKSPSTLKEIIRKGAE